MSDFLSIGKIVNTHGIKGEVKVLATSEDPQRYKKLKTVYIDGEEKTVTGCKLQPNRVILKIEGIDSIEDATRYKNKELKIVREDAIKLPEGRYFVCDLRGCRVESEKGVYFGELFDVIFTGSNDVYWVKNNKEELLVPVLEDIVLDINIEKKLIIIKDLEYWM
ncbi:MAG: ribosome maturation factor RimM [Clostridiaceae bacterium]